jgi:hypothetical protein
MNNRRANFVLLVTLSFIVMLSLATLAASEATTPTQTVGGITLRAKVDDARELESGMAYLTQPAAEVKITLLGKGAALVGGHSLPEGEIDESTPKRYRISSKQSLEWSFSAGTLKQISEDSIAWKAPQKPGVYDIEAKFVESRFFGDASANAEKLNESSRSHIGTLHLKMLVQYPLEKETRGVIDGYPLGIYPDETAPTVKYYISRHRELYAPPKYFAKVTPETKDLLVSKHFRLGDFSFAGERDQVHFVALQYRLVDRLEAMLAKLHERNLEVSGLRILRAYLSPMELERLSRKGIILSDFTRYIYGDAAAIIIDEDSDGKMDNLNNDQTVDVKDIELLADIVEQIEDETHVYGGIGVYTSFKDPHHASTPYLHIDTRGVRSRWGQSSSEE